MHESWRLYYLQPRPDAGPVTDGGFTALIDALSQAITGTRILRAAAGRRT
jgi:hypothetical protein